MKLACLAAVALSVSGVLASPVALANADQIVYAPTEAAPVALVSLESVAVQALSESHQSQLREHIASLPQARKLRLDDGVEISITEGEKALLSLQSIKYMDVTDEVVTGLAIQDKVESYGPLKYKRSDFEPMFSSISIPRMKAFLTRFTSFRTRYYRSSTGADSQKYLLAHLKQIVKSNDKIKVEVTEFVHPWGQNSIIARFETKPNISDKVVIIGAHQDSTNLLPFLAAPGADDDGSGTTSSVAAFTALVNASFVPSSNPVEFHWYSAEEGGLLGSQAVAQQYAADGRKVRAMLQQDMTAWVKAGTPEVIGIVTDFVNTKFTAFLVTLIDAYADIPSALTLCGYACSDHASWTKIGAPSGFAIESVFADSNKNIHSGNDKLDISPEFSFEHMVQFSKLAIAVAVELGGGDDM